MTVSRAILVLLALVATTAARPAAAVDYTTDGWRFEAFIDLFVPITVGGTSTFPPSNGSGSIGVKEGRLLNSLNMAFIGGFEAQRERWGVYVHLLYADLSNTRTSPDVIEIGGRPLPLGADATARLDFRGTFWTVVGTYRVASDRAWYMDLLAGARFLDCSNSFNWQLSGSDESVSPPNRAGYRTADHSGGDGVVGLKGRYSRSTGSPWFASYYLDVGTGSSELTWQAGAGIGYAWSWGDVDAGWRHLDYRMKAGSEIQSLYVDGPDIFFRFHW